MDVDAPRAFKLLQDAYETLSDPKLRDDYDRMLKKKARIQRARVARHVVRKRSHPFTPFQTEPHHICALRAQGLTQLPPLPTPRPSNRPPNLPLSIPHSPPGTCLPGVKRDRAVQLEADAAKSQLASILFRLPRADVKLIES